MQWEAAPRVFMHGHRPHCMAIMSWATALNSLGLCRAHGPTPQWVACPSKLYMAGFVGALGAIIISPMALKVDCGKGKAFGMGYSSF